MNINAQRRGAAETFREDNRVVTPLRRTHAPETREPPPHPGGRRWGYPLKFKMDAIRMVREQGMSVAQVYRKLDIAKVTLERWLDHYDLKKIPPKGANEYPVNPQALAGHPVVRTQPLASVPEPAPAGGRRAHIRDAIGLMKQAVDLLHLACQPKHAAKEPHND